MFHSLRLRLWFSYAILIFTALAVVGVVLILFLLRNPLLYRKTFVRLTAAQAVLAAPSAPTGRMQEISEAFDVRVLLFSDTGALIADSAADQAAMTLPPDPRGLHPTGLECDRSGRAWFYSVKQLSSGNWLLVAAPRPKIVPLLAILTDELSAPLIEGGLIALLLSLVLAFLIARWVADPLERLILAAGTLPTENIAPVEEGGPQEIRKLTRAFNSMARRVRAGRAAQRDFVANVSHELKTPLTSIQGFAQALMDGTADQPEARRQAAEVIYSEAGRMHRMALNLLDLARLDAGTASMNEAPVDMLALLRGICEKFQPMATNAGVTLKVSLPVDLPPLIGDGDRLAQVFSNLVDNALEFTPRGGAIAIRAIENLREIQVSVNDTGRGIPASAIPHIFDRFYRAESARTGGNEHGAGLGLAIVQEVVAAHGGRISVRSAEGRGTGFVVHLPLTRTP